MSIFTKVLILFLSSLLLMLFVSNKTERVMEESLQSLLKEKYIQVSDELFKYLANNDMDALNRKLQELQFKIISDDQEYLDTSKVIYTYDTELSSIKILQHEDNEVLLYMRYLDDAILVIDLAQYKSFEEMTFLNYLILGDILILILLFLIILKMIYPLKMISKNIKAFGEGDYSTRIKVVSDDEITEVSNTFNAMATNIEALISSRERLLRDIGHELKTPISKSKFALEMIDEPKYRGILHRALLQMDEMINDLLNLEKLNAERSTLKLETFNIETLVSTSLSKLFVEDENSIEVRIESNFEIEADLNYLSIALKNLIDNALKYKTGGAVLVVVTDREISVKSRGEVLEKPLDFYCGLFIQGDDSREKVGHGLGLSMVKRILDKHSFIFTYSYMGGYNTFTIQT